MRERSSRPGTHGDGASEETLLGAVLLTRKGKIRLDRSSRQSRSAPFWLHRPDRTYSVSTAYRLRASPWSRVKYGEAIAGLDSTPLMARYPALRSAATGGVQDVNRRAAEGKAVS